MGSFTEWLISSYGIEKYINFFNEDDAESAASKIYQKSTEELSLLFLNYVSLFDNDELIEQRMCKLINEEKDLSSK